MTTPMLDILVAVGAVAFWNFAKVANSDERCEDADFDAPLTFEA